MTKDTYIDKYVRIIQDSNCKKEAIEGVLDRVYEDGFEDGTNNPIEK